MKKTLALLLSLCLVFILIPRPIHATVIVNSGECGEHGDELTWHFADDGTLTISGTGKMRDYVQYDPPWRERKVKHVVIEEGVSYIGDNAFHKLPYLQTVTVADSVTEIGSRAFADCDKLVSVTLGSKLKKPTMRFLRIVTN